VSYLFLLDQVFTFYVIFCITIARLLLFVSGIVVKIDLSCITYIEM
jgi:hypothetical protein